MGEAPRGLPGVRSRAGALRQHVLVGPHGRPERPLRWAIERWQACSQRSRALAKAPKVRVIGKAAGGVRVAVEDISRSDQLPSPTAQATRVAGIADAIADALGLSPGGLKVAKIDGR